MISHVSALMAILKNVPMLQIMITVMNADCLRRKKMNKLDMSKEYSTRFDELRMNRVEVSYYKYGPASQNFGRGNVQAIPTLERCLQKIQRNRKYGVFSGWSKLFDVRIYVSSASKITFSGNR